MRLKLYDIILAALVFNIPVLGQKSPSDLSYILEDLYSRIVNTNDDIERLRLNDSVIILVEGYVKSDSATRHKLDVRNLGQIDSPDRKLKIINWNLALRDGSNKYLLYIIRYGKKGYQDTVYKLTGGNSIKPILTDVIYSEDNWYGAVYYDIQPFKTGNDVGYLILGIDFGNTYITRKIIDVLSFNGKGEISFGRNCFQRDKDLRSRGGA